MAWTRELAAGDSKCIGSASVLKVKPTAFADRKYMEYEKEGGSSQE